MKKGVLFYHRHWLTVKRTPQLFVVTRVARGEVYYRSVEPDGTLGMRMRSSEEQLLARYMSPAPIPLLTARRCRLEHGRA